MKNIFVYVRLFGFVLWMILMMPVLFVISKTKVLSPYYNRWYFKMVSRLFLGLKPKIRRGKLADTKNLLLVCNHNSYLDIFALGSLLKINFVSKDDVKNWPIFGKISKLGNTVYISRDRMKAGREIGLLENEFEKRKLPLLIFPEGTSTDGTAMLPFKSSLFALFEDKIGKKSENPITIQPVSIAYTYKGKKKMTDDDRRIFAWYIKEQGLVEHLVNAIKNAPFTVEVILHDPIDISTGFKDRKDLALYCHDIVEQGFKELTEK